MVKRLLFADSKNMFSLALVLLISSLLDVLLNLFLKG